MTLAPGGVRRWPLHPPPGPGEALTSWLARLAGLYGMTAGYMLRHNLGEASALLDDPRATDLDFDPPGGILQALAERTGTDLGVVRLTTIAGWLPWLADTLDPGDGQNAFHTYVRQDSVLLAPGEAGRNAVSRWPPWMPAPDKEWRTTRRACPACAAMPGQGASLLGALPMMTTCGEHGCRLEPEVSVLLAAAERDPMPDRPAPAPVAAMDRLTFESVTNGMVTLPRRSVHVGVWFRLLRTLVDEVSIAASRGRPPVGRHPRESLGRHRPAAPRGPERLAALRAARLAAPAGDARSRGHRASASRGRRGHRTRDTWPASGPRAVPARRRRRPDRLPLEARAAEASAVIDKARSDPDTARHVLAMFTGPCMTLASFNRERDYLIGIGIPAEFLPNAGELGRAGLS